MPINRNDSSSSLDEEYYSENHENTLEALQGLEALFYESNCLQEVKSDKGDSTLDRELLEFKQSLESKTQQELPSLKKTLLQPDQSQSQLLMRLSCDERTRQDRLELHALHKRASNHLIKRNLLVSGNQSTLFNKENKNIVANQFYEHHFKLENGKLNYTKNKWHI